MDMTGVELLCAAMVDAVVGDPHWLPHPVRLMGRAIAWCDGQVRTICRSPSCLRVAGLVLAITLPVAAYGIGAMAIEAGTLIAPWAGSVVAVVLGAMTLAARDLWNHAHAVVHPLEAGDLPTARQAVAMIVGRDTAQLSESEVARAAVETLAESAADGVIAPLFYLAVGGVPLALAYKAINTLDSMIGHRDERYAEFGWASARLDDVANWIPARLTAVLLLCAASTTTQWRGRVSQGWRVWQRDGGLHPSPNSGQPEAAMAGVLGVRVGGRNWYDGVAQDRPVMGAEGRSPVPGDIWHAARLMVGAALVGLCAAVWWRWLV